jgi:hypothetical protein
VVRADVAAYRDGMAAEWLTLLLLSAVVAGAARYLFAVLLPSLADVEWPAAARWVRRRRPQPEAPRRSIEEIAKDLRRLGPRFRRPPRGTSRTKVEAARYAYDRVLGEAATAVGVEHLLAVLEPGDELDVERHRVENRLWLAGLRFDEAA